MNTNEVLKLIDAGFTADEIRGMMATAANTAASADPAPAPAADPTPTAENTEPAAASGPEPVQPGLTQDQALAAVLNRMNDTLNRIQASNIIHDTASSVDREQTADDIIQELIFPGNNK